MRFPTNALAIASLVLAAVTVPGCSEDEIATAQVVFTGDLERGPAPADKCTETGKLFETGDFGNPNVDTSKPGNELPNIAPTPTLDGEQNTQVLCSVKQLSADEFDVSGNIVAAVGNGGTFRISGRLKPGVDNPNLSSTMGRRGLPSYTQNNGCTVRFEERGQGVVAGRMWGVIRCPAMEHTGNALEPCQGIATFKFENCGQ